MAVLDNGRVLLDGRFRGRVTMAAVAETPDGDELVESIRAVVAGVTARFDRAYFTAKAASGEEPLEMYRAMADDGLFEIGVPEHRGGAGGGVLGVSTVISAMCENGTTPMHFCITSFARMAVLAAGTQAQIDRFVTPTLTGEAFLGFAVTEPHSGSNFFGLSTRAVRRPDGGYRLTGRKHYITGVGAAAALVVLARTTPREEVERPTDGISLLVVPTDTAGLGYAPMGMGLHEPEHQYDVWFDDVALPAEALIGEEGRGVTALFASFNAERVVAASMACGLGNHALARAVAHASQRAPWGPAIGSYQGVSHPLARVKARLLAAESVTRNAADHYDRGVPSDLATVAKLLASEAAGDAIDAAIQVHGGAAFDTSTDLLALWPMIRLLRVSPVHNELVLNYIAERVLRLPRGL